MSCGQIPAACPTLIWSRVMRIMSKESWTSLALVQLGPTAPWDTGQTGRAQGALINRSVHPIRRKEGGAKGSSDDGWGSSRAFVVDRSERQEWGLWSRMSDGLRCWQCVRLCQHLSVWSCLYGESAPNSPRTRLEQKYARWSNFWNKLFQPKSRVEMGSCSYFLKKCLWDRTQSGKLWH